jgi:2-phosphosulfolactate phosphatase
VAASSRRIAIIPAGERWPDGSLRPCVEDLVGAGAVLASLPGKRSPEAEIALAAFERLRGHFAAALTACASGQELAGRGFLRDIDLASQYAVSAAVPLLTGDRFIDASSATADSSPSSATPRPDPA